MDLSIALKQTFSQNGDDEHEEPDNRSEISSVLHAFVDDADTKLRNEKSKLFEIISQHLRKLYEQPSVLHEGLVFNTS
ncbi:hypothetical protein HPP92_023506 [Vanilla planifolia]|uniref:Uncharacterized protein n=1 Tax=Vanilla planifolia TaxID=51239 RepID=A0A835UCX0_VANPL|nr:hypothetical protein HPP92_023506 [Vanilla planifolia]